jgi:hypothetical protein
VQAMIERNWLHDRRVLAARPGCTNPEHRERWYCDRKRDQPHQRTSRDSSRAGREECRHQLSECEVSRSERRAFEGCNDSAYIAPEHAPRFGHSCSNRGKDVDS